MTTERTRRGRLADLIDAPGDIAAFARDLAALGVPDLPPWTRQMQAFILADVGDREAARDVMRVILETDTTLQAEERHFIEQFLRLRLGDGGDR